MKAYMKQTVFLVSCLFGGGKGYKQNGAELVLGGTVQHQFPAKKSGRQEHLNLSLYILIQQQNIFFLATYLDTVLSQFTCEFMADLVTLLNWTLKLWLVCLLLIKYAIFSPPTHFTYSTKSAFRYSPNHLHISFFSSPA